MTLPGEWAEIQRIFAEVSEGPRADRASTLDRHCADRPQVRAEVESLLRSHDHATAFLEPASPSALGDAPEIATDRGGLRVGPFQLIRPVGSGGMSVVYLAERVDGEFSQRVAVKIIDTPLRSADALQRFRAERQILATFTHPNIVSLIDAGVTGAGQAYLVMEFVEGQPITEHCRDQRLSLDARIALIRNVCAAVQYAHQHGVVHRDLKPANILVTADGVAKVLDFGVAKLLNDSILETTDATVAGFRPLTPNYASPEQWRGQPTTTAADIYALGVLTYETLSGTRPYDTSDKPLDEVLRIVGEVDPPRPSAASADQASLPFARRSLEGNLDAIVLKAMSKEPDARYSSARQLSDDLGRHVNGEPVTARPPSTRDLLMRLARRHRAAFVAAAVSLVALVGALGISIWQTRAARLDRDRATARFDDARQLANALIFKIHDGVAPLPGSTPVRKMIVSEALVYLERLSRDPAGDDALRLELARGYHRVADVQGYPGTPNLGDRAGAQASYRSGLALLRAITAAPLVREATLEVGRIDVSLALALGAKGQEAEAAVMDAMAAADRLLRADPGDADALRLLGSAHFQNALMIAPSAALAEWQVTSAIFEKLLAARPTDSDRRRNVALVQKYIGGHYENDRAYAQALPYYQRALTLDEERLEAQPSNRYAQFDVAVDLSSVGLAEHKAGRSVDAARDLERCLKMREQLAASDPKDVQARNRLQLVHSRLASVYVDLGRLDEAIVHLGQALTIAEAQSGIDAESRKELADVLQMLGDAERKAGRLTAGCEHSRRALREITALQAAHSMTPELEAVLAAARLDLERQLKFCGPGRNY